MSQEYFESSTIFAYILESKYRSPLKDFLLGQLTLFGEEDIVLIFDNLINKSITKGGKIEVESVTTKRLYIVEVYVQMIKLVC